MNFLPTEIRQLIVDHLAAVEYCFDSNGYYAGTLEHIADIKSLRLTCRAFAGLGNDHLFCSIWLFMTDTSFEKLQFIAATPSLAKYVRRLKIFWCLLDANSFKTETAYRLHIANSYSRSASEEALKQGWLAVRSLISQHQRLSHQLCDLLTSVLPAFSRLSEFGPGMAWEVLRHDRAMELHCGTIQGLARKTLLSDSSSGWTEGLHDGKQLYGLFRAIACTRRQGQKLNLFNCGANMSSNFLEFPEDMLETAKTVAGGLKEVRLRIEMEDLADYGQIISKGVAPRFLNWLEKTQRLSLQTSQHGPLIELPRIIPSTITLPCLKYLALYRFSAEASSLSSVMDRHAETLETISLAEILLTEGSWRDIFTTMKGLKVLNDFHFEDNRVSNGLDHPYSESININDRKVQKALEKFVFYGEDWPRKACDDFEMVALC